MRRGHHGFTLMESIVGGLLVFLLIGSLTTFMSVFFLRSVKEKQRSAAHNLAIQVSREKQIDAFSEDLGAYPLGTETLNGRKYESTMELNPIGNLDPDKIREMKVLVSWSDRQGEHSLTKTIQVIHAKNS